MAGNGHGRKYNTIVGDIRSTRVATRARDRFDLLGVDLRCKRQGRLEVRNPRSTTLSNALAERPGIHGVHGLSLSEASANVPERLRTLRDGCSLARGHPESLARGLRIMHVHRGDRDSTSCLGSRALFVPASHWSRDCP